MTKELENKREIWRREKKIFIVVHMQKTRSQSGRACKYVHVICDKIDVIMRKNSRCHWGSYFFANFTVPHSKFKYVISISNT